MTERPGAYMRSCELCLARTLVNMSTDLVSVQAHARQRKMMARQR